MTRSYGVWEKNSLLSVPPLDFEFFIWVYVEVYLIKVVCDKYVDFRTIFTPSCVSFYYNY